MKITICGGGSLGHVCAGVFASQRDVDVNIFTQQPNRWNKEITTIDNEGKIYSGKLNIVSSDPNLCIKGSDIVFLCLPGFAIERVLREIKPYLSEDTIVGSIVSSTGFFFKAHEIFGFDNTKLFGFQRVPYIARTKEYGSSAYLLGYKKELAIATENVDDVCKFKDDVAKLFLTPTKLLNNYYEASLTNSNPILHTGRLFSMWHNWCGEEYDHNILFYKEWTEEASQMIIDMDAEFMALLEKLPVDKSLIPTLLGYYESFDATSLTKKISSIEAFQTITSPMIKSEGGWVPDFSSRYFTEDFPHGLKYIVDLAKQNNVSIPIIDKVYEWGISKMNI